MSEADINPESQKPKASRLAIWVLFLGVWTSCVLGIVSFFLVPSLYLLKVCVLILELSGMAGLILGIFSLLKMKYTWGRLIRCGLVEFGIVTVAVFIMFIAVAVQRGLDTANQMICGSNLSGLAKTMLTYADDNDGKYPVADKWCDLLIEGNYENQKGLKCPAAKKGPCSYAMNKNAELNSPADIVLLFESKPGWNQVGGPEMLTIDNHNGRGCFILFNDTHVKFVKTEQLGELKWKFEESNGVGKGFSK